VEGRMKYGLYHKGEKKLLTFHCISNKKETTHCVDISYRLDTSSENIWVVSDTINAEYVRRFSTEWYQAEYKTPKHDYDEDELEVVEVKEIFTPVEATMGTIENYYRMKYKRFNPYHYEECIKTLKMHRTQNYDYRYNTVSG
jgi:hypothetical protein